MEEINQQNQMEAHRITKEATNEPVPLLMTAIWIGDRQKPKEKTETKGETFPLIMEIGR